MIHCGQSVPSQSLENPVHFKVSAQKHTMKLGVSIALVVCFYALAMAAPKKEVYDLEKAPGLFDSFVKEYNREYKDDADRQAHFEAFKQNLEKINEQNAKSKSATFGINKFADYTDEEKKSMFGYKGSK